MSLVIFAATPADIKKFPPVSGEIYGQAAEGVKSISVNGKPVIFDANQNFRAFVRLRAGDKYLILRINYEGVRIIKKYLILRRPQVKTFKVFVPKEKLEKPPVPKKTPPAKKRETAREAARRRALLEKRRIEAEAARKKMLAKKARPAAAPAQIFEYLYVWEFSEGKLLLVKKTEGKYSAEIFVPVSKEWLDLKGLSEKELRELIARPVKVKKKK